MNAIGAKPVLVPVGSPSGPTRRTEDLAVEVERCFRDFRESAVRLAERVSDLETPSSDAFEAGRGDLRLLRSIFSKWSPDVLVALHAVPSIGFEELRRTLVGISPRVLSIKLKELEENRMVRREILDTRPPRVRYALTDRGWTVAWLAQPVLLYLRLTERDLLPRPDENGGGSRVPGASEKLVV